nr:MAG TPA: hypothetical protein [Caudoviricetes sp.]
MTYGGGRRLPHTYGPLSLIHKKGLGSSFECDAGSDFE